MEDGRKEEGRSRGEWVRGRGEDKGRIERIG